MNNRNTIQEELKSLNSSLADGAALQPYQVPEGYFDQLPAAILKRISESNLAEDPVSELSDLSPLLASIPKTNPFRVPEGYFGSNLEMLPALNGTELPAFGKLPQPFSVPEGYFEQLPQLILQKVQEKKPARVVSMGNRKWMRYAAAAVVAGIMTIAGFRYFGGSREIPVDSPQWVAQKLKNVSDQAIDEFVKTTAVNPNNTASLSRSKSSEDRRILKDVSDSELDSFLDQVPVEEELAIN